MPALLKTPLARKRAASFWASRHEVFRLTTLDRRVFVSWAAEMEAVSYRFCFFQLFSDIHPHRNICISVCASDEVHTVLGSTQQHIDSVNSPEKAHLALRVTSDKRHDDDFGLFSLEIVDCSKAERLEQTFPLEGFPVIAVRLALFELEFLSS
jgi:hypothetical protein